MPLPVKRPPVNKTVVKALKPATATPGHKTTELKRSTLAVFDIPIELLVDSEENANEQDEATFDQIVQAIKTDGFDEPIKVIPIEDGPNKGKYIIVSGHHRKKAGVVAGMKAIPAVIKEGWDDDKRKIELIAQNMRRGQLNPEKFTRAFNELRQKGYDMSVLKLRMGFTKDEIFNKVYKAIEQRLSPVQKERLASAKEKITSIEGISSALHDVFKEHGTDLDHGFVIVSYAGKSHHYIEADKALHTAMTQFEEECKNRGIFAADAFKAMLANVDLSKIKKSDKVVERKAIREAKK